MNIPDERSGFLPLGRPYFRRMARVGNQQWGEMIESRAEICGIQDCSMVIRSLPRRSQRRLAL